MKKIFALMLALVLCMALALCFPCAAGAVSWTEITGEDTYGDTEVKWNGDGYMIFGGTIENVSVGTGPLGGASIIFSGVTFTGEAVTLAARDNVHRSVMIESTCTDRTQQGVRVIAENTDRESGYNEEDREWRFDTQMTVSLDCSVNGLHVEAAEAAAAWVYAYQSSGAVFMTAKNGGRMDAGIYGEAAAMEARSERGGMFNISSASSAPLTIVNENGAEIIYTYTGDETKAQKLSISMSNTGGVKLRGNHPLGEEDKPLHISITDAGRRDDVQQLEQSILNDVLDMLNPWNVACKKNGAPQIHVTANYQDLYFNDKTLDFTVKLHHAKTNVLSSASTGHAAHPTLVSASGASQSLELETLYTDLNAGQKFYALRLTKNGEPVDLPTDAELYFPYPQGVNASSSKYFSFGLSAENGMYYATEYSTPDLPLQRTDKGLMISLKTQESGQKPDKNDPSEETKKPALGNFRLTWREKSAQNGDWGSLLRALYEQVDDPSNSGRNPVSASITVQDETYGDATVTAEYDRRTNTTTVYGGRLDTVNLCWQDDEGEYWFGDFGVRPGTYVFRDILLMDDIYVRCWDGSDFTLVLEETVGGRLDLRAPASAWRKGGFGVDVGLFEGADVVIRNDTTLYSDRFHSLSVSMDCGASFDLTGRGRVLAGGGVYLHPTIEDWEIPDPRPMYLSISAITNDNAEAIRMIESLYANDLHIEEKQFSGGKNYARTYFDRLRPGSREAFDIEESYLPVHKSERSLKVGDDMPQLLMSDAGEDMVFIVSQVDLTGTQGNAVHYELDTCDVQSLGVIGEGTQLYLPYPDGMDMDSAAAYQFTVRHYSGDREEIFSTEDGSMERTPYGLKLPVSGMSPYVLGWEEAAVGVDSLPRTGDSSSLALWICLMGMAGAALLLLRKRAHN